MAHGARSGIMSLTVSALLTCYRSRFQTWILPLPLHYRGAESAPDARRIWLQPLENDEFLAAIAHWFSAALHRHRSSVGGVWPLLLSIWFQN